MKTITINPILFAGLYSFIISLLVIPIVIHWSKKRNLLDAPNHRASHSVPTPTLGGIGIFIASFSAILIWSKAPLFSEITIFLGAILVFFVVGLRDDLTDLRASLKFFIQLFLSFLIAYSGIRIQSLHGLFGIYELHVVAQYVLTTIVIAGVTNAINLLDGINGLAGGISFINLMVFAFLFFKYKNQVYVVAAISLAGGVLGFLRYNFNKAKIFMGDTGSLLLGFSLAVFGIKFLQIGADSSAQSLLIVVGLMTLPVFDTVRVFALRIVKGNSPFTADKTHVHHLLLKLGLSHMWSSIVLYLVNLILVGMAIMMDKVSLDLKLGLALMIVSAFCLGEIITIIKMNRAKNKYKNLKTVENELVAKNALLKKYM